VAPDVGPENPLQAAVGDLPGVGPARSKALAEAGLRTAGDLLWHLPFRYEDRRNPTQVKDLRAGEPALLLAEVKAIQNRRARGRDLSITEALLSDTTGTVHAIWFNQPYLERSLPNGTRAYFFGAPSLFSTRQGLRLQMDNPEVEKVDGGGMDPVHGARIVPVHHRVGELGARVIRTLVHRCLERVHPPEVFPQSLLVEEGLPGRSQAFAEAHFPGPETAVADLARRRTPAFKRLIFEEFLGHQLEIQRIRSTRKGKSGIQIEITRESREAVRRMLPFALTNAQKRSLKEIAADMASPEPMYRLLQGDVGSGKTILAFAAMVLAAKGGFQAAFLAPTEILAGQQFERLSQLARPEGLATVFLTSSVKGRERRAALEALASGAARFAVGTHSLFQEGVDYARLGLVVVDEQHRFGVEQRAKMVAKGKNPDVLVMSATPIPRSLAMTLYGDLDLSVLDELPPGRAPLVTAVRSEDARPRVEAFLRREMDEGRQIFVVYPLVEESEALDLRAASESFERLRLGPYRGYPLALLHGRMTGPEKEEVMRGFRAGKLKMLVTTSVVEVGVDLPEASVMVVEHAERFGLAQLHQLRGRVGRGGARGYCILFPSKGTLDAGLERLSVLARTGDGFVIAEEDLRLRGAGEAGGTRQWGGGSFRVAHPLRDFDILENARGWAGRLERGEVLLCRDERERLDEWRASLGDRLGGYAGIG
jgi:ATP-dependent DNA helicase RecG